MVLVCSTFSIKSKPRSNFKCTNQHVKQQPKTTITRYVNWGNILLLPIQEMMDGLHKDVQIVESNNLFKKCKNCT